MRQLIVEIVGEEITGIHVAWPLLTPMLAQPRQGEVMGNTVCHCVESLSTSMWTR